MNPNQPQYSIDYLNQIAPQAPKTSWLSRKQLIIIAAAGLVILIIGAFGFGVTAINNTTQPSKQLAARLQSTEKIVGDAQTKISSSQLGAINSNLHIYLTGANLDIIAPLAKEGISTTKLDKNLIASEAGTAMINRLEDARLNAVYDRTYAREMAYQLQTILTLMHQILVSTNNKDLKSFLTNASTNLSPTQKQFAQFNAADG